MKFIIQIYFNLQLKANINNLLTLFVFTRYYYLQIVTKNNVFAYDLLVCYFVISNIIFDINKSS